MQNKFFAPRWLLASLALLGATRLCAYSLQTDASGIYVNKWQTSPVTMQLKLPNNTVLSDGNTLQSSVVAAMQKWNALLGTVQLSPQLSVPGAYHSGNSVNEIVMDSTMDGDAFPSGVLAITLSYTNGNAISEADLIFNNVYTWNSYRGSLRFGMQDIQRVAIHELGHVLGLNHPDQNGQSVVAIMNSVISNIDTMQPDDIAGAQKLYAAPGFVPENDSFLAATPITLTPAYAYLSGSNMAASRESGEPDHAGSSSTHSVWWKWTASIGGQLDVTTTGSDFDTVLGVYTGASVSSLTSVAANDDEESLDQNSTPQRKRTSKVSFRAAAGTTYYFAVAGWGDRDPGGIPSGYTGNIKLNLAFTQLEPLFTLQPTSRTIVYPFSLTLQAIASGSSVFYQWQRNGAPLTEGPLETAFNLGTVQPADTGIYTAIATAGGVSATSNPAIVGLQISTKLVGAATEVDHDVHHPNGNTFDQILLQGLGASFTADYLDQQISRLSFVDLNDDIVQVEFSGPGTVSIALDGSSAPAAAVNYNQPDVAYVKGHAGIVVTGATEDSHLAIFSVGRANAVNQELFRANVAYDGVADLAYVAILSANGKFGGLRLGNVNFFATRGYTGVYAPNVQFTGPVYVGDINAHDNATPVLVLGGSSDVRITGGGLLQANGRAVQVSGITQLQFTEGMKSSGTVLPAQPNHGRLEQNGTDVTAQVVSPPPP
ncbi:MAG TPA: matrixin family metalloprotease [Opitutaceae bacterium]|nr:matrixin family metalloprotease [Opitutaceae bacterium]